jgi:hypothetical protein
MNGEAAAVGAHPRDVASTSGGSLARWTGERWLAYLVAFTDGRKGSQDPWDEPMANFMSGDCCSSGVGDCCVGPIGAPILLEVQLAVCPSCGEKGKAVDGQTVKAMLAVSLLEMTHEPYLFEAWS